MIGAWDDDGHDCDESCCPRPACVAKRDAKRSLDRLRDGDYVPPRGLLLVILSAMANARRILGAERFARAA